MKFFGLALALLTTFGLVAAGILAGLWLSGGYNFAVFDVLARPLASIKNHSNIRVDVTIFTEN